MRKIKLDAPWYLQTGASCWNNWHQAWPLTYIHLDCQLGFEERYQRWPKYESVCSWSYCWPVFLVLFKSQRCSITLIFVIIRQPSWFSIDNAKFKRKYCEQAVQMYLCQWAWQWIKFSTDCICLVDNLQQLEQATRTHAHIDSMTPGWKPCGLLTACSHGQERLDANCRVYLLDTSLSSSCTKPVGFFKLHWRLPKSDVMQFNICRLAAWVVETTSCILKTSCQTTRLKPVDNLQQTFYHLAGESDANTSWYRGLDECEVTSLQQILLQLARLWLC